MLRFKSVGDLTQQADGASMSGPVYEQLKAALADADQQSSGSQSGVGGSSQRQQSRSVSKRVSGESKGEAAVRLALTAAFGAWADGGEVLAECRPFQTRKFRADFSLPLRKITVEVEGWSHHGRSLDDHHRDRERAIFFASHNWLVFPVSHAQALQDTPMLIDAVARAMALRPPIPRESIQVESIPHKHGVWHQLYYR